MKSRGQITRERRLRIASDIAKQVSTDRIRPSRLHQLAGSLCEVLAMPTFSAGANLTGVAGSRLLKKLSVFVACGLHWCRHFRLTAPPALTLLPQDRAMSS